MGRHVLVVEDHETTRAVVESLLRANGYEVTGAPDAEQGLEILARTPVDLVLLDMFLPKASGIQFLMIRAQRNVATNVPVIVMSGSDQLDSLKPQLNALGVGLTLRKPLDVEALLSAVKAQTAPPSPAAPAKPPKIEKAKARAKRR